MIYKIFKFFRPKPNLHSFTYYIPGPPARTTGYREKEFDKEFNRFINHNRLKIIKTEFVPHSTGERGGAWFNCIVEGEVDSQFQFESTSPSGEFPAKPPLEEMYYLENDDLP